MTIAFWSFGRGLGVSSCMAAVTALAETGEVTCRSDVDRKTAIAKGTLQYLDTESTLNPRTNTILDKADLVVVFLPQSALSVDFFFEYFSSISKKAVFCMNKFKPGDVIVPEYLRSKYRIDLSRSVIVPFSDEFRDAAAKGRVAEFIAENLNCRHQERNYSFMTSLRHLSNTIMCETEEIISENAGEVIAV